jgi:hypothetical protein
MSLSLWKKTEGREEEAKARETRSFRAGLLKSQVFEKIFTKVLTYFACR